MNTLDLSFSDLKRLVSIEQLLAARGLLAKLRRQGDSLVGACPLHGGDNPRAFVVSLVKGRWYCFTRCHRGGDVVDLVRALDGIGYAETARYLSTLALLGTSTRERRGSRCEPGRSFTPFSPRLNLDAHAPFLVEKGIRAETAQRFEVGLFSGKGWLERCLAVRLHDPSGIPLGYAGRRLDPAEATERGKWKLPPRFPKSSTLYNHHRTRPVFDRGIAVVECPWSVMRLDQIGVPAVALFGTSLSSFQRHLLAPAQRVLLLLDGDLAGRQAALCLRSTWAPSVEISIADLPDGHDPDDLDDEQLRDICELILRS